MDQPTFCVVCGRFDRELVIRKSGLKCAECVGKRHNKGFAQLQHQQATFVLSRTMHPQAATGGGQHYNTNGMSPLVQTMQPTAGGYERRTSFDLNATTGGSRGGGQMVPGLNLGPLGSPRGGSSEQQPLGSPRTARGGAQHPSPQMGAAGAPPGGPLPTLVTNNSMTSNSSFHGQPTGHGGIPGLLIPVLEVNFDTLQVQVTDVEKAELVKKGVIDTKEEVTTYAFKVIQADSGIEVITMRHRFRQVHSVFVAIKAVGQHSLPEIPEKKIIGRFDAAFVEQRRKDCEFFVNAAMQNPFLARHPQLLGLLGLDLVLREQERLRRAAVASGKPLPQATNNSFASQQAMVRSGSPSSIPNNANNSSISGPGHLTSSGSHLVPQADLDNCRLGSVIGQGSFGTVHLGLLPSSSKLVAVKVMKVSSVHQNQIDVLQAELDLLRTLSHRNIVQFLGISWNGEKRDLCFFTEYVECGSVASMVKKFGSLPLSVIQRYMRQLLLGVAYLHELDVVHRDIKGDNILVTKDGSIKVADFGCSTQLKELDVENGGGGAAAAEGVTGTPLWMAPEAMRGEAQSFPADIWSIGCVGIEMLGNQPWKLNEHENVFTAMFRIQKSEGPPDGLPAEDSEKIDPCFRKMLLRCFKKNPEERPTAKELLADEFFATELGDMSIDETIVPLPHQGVATAGSPFLDDADAEFDFA